MRFFSPLLPIWDKLRRKMEVIIMLAFCMKPWNILTK